MINETGDSDDQFEELVAYLSAHLNRALGKSNEITPLGLLLLADGNVEVVLATLEQQWSLSQALSVLQRGLADKAQQSNAVASCIAYPDYQNGQIIAYLENNEQFCAKCLIPVITDPSIKLDLENIEVEDGEIFVFGASSLSSAK